MSFFDAVILDVIFILFPSIVILILEANYKNFGEISKKYLIDIGNFVALFFLITYGNYENTYEIILLNIPFIISILYKRRLASIVIAIIMVFIYYTNGYHISIKIIEYLIYLIIFFIFAIRNKSYSFVISVFLFIEGVCITIEEVYILGNNDIFTLAKIFLSLVIFYLVSMLIIIIIDMVRDTISLNQTLKELEREKNLKNALFKITHEVKNPIAVCKGYLSMMDYDNIDKVKKYNEIIESELNRTLDIMDNFSRYTKIKVDKDIMDLDSLIRKVISNMSSVFEAYKVEVVYDYDDELFINGDYGRLKQVLVNILKNSCEAIKRDGRININLSVDNKNIYLNIRDNGCGMSPEELESVDQLFFTSKDKGCGIGVSIAKEIIRLHDGELEYDSVLNEFTEVKIKFPKTIDLH